MWRLCAGEPVYPGERERILGQKARRTRRLAARAARRSKVISSPACVSGTAHAAPCSLCGFVQQEGAGRQN